MHFLISLLRTKTIVLSCFILFMQCASFASQAAPITVIHNVKGYTTTDQKGWHSFQAVAFTNGRIIGTGDLAQFKKRFAKATFIDGKGQTLLPGLIDAHGHVIGLGQAIFEVDLRGTTSQQDSVDRVVSHAKANRELTWLRGRGWNQELWENNSFPTAKALDEYFPSLPIWLVRVDGHAGWANSAAMKLAGVSSSTITPEGGEITRDEQGNPTGIFVDNAMSLITDVIPSYSRPEQQKALDLAEAHLLSLGITSVHDAGIDYSTYQLYRENAAKNQLVPRLYAMLGADSPKLSTMLNNGIVATDNGQLLIRSVKIYADGALGSRGAALLKPYQDAPHNHGLLLQTPEELNQLFTEVLNHRFQINTHAIGDKANKLVLDLLAFHQEEKPQISLLRHRIEHAQIIDKKDLSRFKTLALIPSMQPTHATSDMNMAEDRLGKKRLVGAYAWQTLLKQGNRIAAGSDFPVELANPFFGIHAAVTRQDRNNNPLKGWRIDEAMSVEQAMTAFTIDAAYAGHQELELGSLEAGKWADFILVDQDPFTIAEQDLWKIKVHETWVAGKQVFRQAK